MEKFDEDRPGLVSQGSQPLQRYFGTLLRDTGKEQAGKIIGSPSTGIGTGGGSTCTR